jgi:hypothetical protein
MIRILVRQVGHTLLFDQITAPREQLHQPRDALLEQALGCIAGGGARRIEDGPPSVRRDTPSSTRQCRWTLRFAAEPNRWMSATAPASAAVRFSPDCPQSSPSRWANTLAMTSLEAPGAKGTTHRTDLAGNASAADTGDDATPHATV